MIWSYFFLYIFFTFDMWSVSETAATKHRCYVCVPNTGSSIADVTNMFPKNTNIPLCNNFQPGNTDYMLECPSPSYQGCLTQTNGTHVTKTCTDVGIEDCKTANKITYCYCKGDLCNGEPVPTEAPVEIETTEDDEDSQVEGSGSTEDESRETVETSSEADLGIEISQNQVPTTTAIVTLTTSRPDDSTIAKASANVPAQTTTALALTSLLLIAVRI